MSAADQAMRQIVFETNRTDNHDVAELERELHNLSEGAIPVVDRDHGSLPTRRAENKPSDLSALFAKQEVRRGTLLTVSCGDRFGRRRPHTRYCPNFDLVFMTVSMGV